MYKVFANLELVATFLWIIDAVEYVELMQYNYPKNDYLIEGE